jgi:hypothetical protein
LSARKLHGFCTDYVHLPALLSAAGSIIAWFAVARRQHRTLGVRILKHALCDHSQLMLAFNEGLAHIGLAGLTGIAPRDEMEGMIATANGN